MAGQRRGEGIADHIDGVGGILDTERDPQVGVGPDVLPDRTGGPLRGEDEVHAQAAAPLRQPHQRGNERRQVGDQGGELVHHHHEPWKRRPAAHGTV